MLIILLAEVYISCLQRKEEKQDITMTFKNEIKTMILPCLDVDRGQVLGAEKRNFLSG